MNQKTRVISTVMMLAFLNVGGITVADDVFLFREQPGTWVVAGDYVTASTSAELTVDAAGSTHMVIWYRTGENGEFIITTAGETMVITSSGAEDTAMVPVVVPIEGNAVVSWLSGTVTLDRYMLVAPELTPEPDTVTVIDPAARYQPGSRVESYSITPAGIASGYFLPALLVLLLVRVALSIWRRR